MTRGIILAGMMALAITTQSYAQETQDIGPVSSGISSADRYEMVFSPLAAKWMFRLDRFCGGVDMLVHDKDDNQLWERMKVEPVTHCGSSPHAHFQIICSGLAAKWTLLMDTSTGTTWQLLHDPKTDEDFWGLIG
jgi:hypothetical protein